MEKVYIDLLTILKDSLFEIKVNKLGYFKVTLRLLKVLGDILFM